MHKIENLITFMHNKKEYTLYMQYFLIKIQKRYCIIILVEV